mgnify:FL=1
MIEQTYYYIQKGTEPSQNLALERYLLETVPEHTCILYLWQNQHTVVIGRNQNCWQECKLQQLADDGGVMVRRLSGGGAVYHDLGNLNFTFLIGKEDYDVAKQLDVILQALQQLGIQAEKSGRNDLTANGRKFSGNAFYESGNRCYHHGTLMVQVDREMLGKYLQVSASKLASKGVSSVQSRVVNLAELKEGLTIAQLQQALVDAMQLVYGKQAQPYPEQWLDQKQIAAYQAEFISDAWRFGQRLPFTWETEHRFGWGNFHLQCAANYGKIEQAIIYSDAMDANLIGQLAEQLQGCDFSSKAMAERLQQLGERTEVQDVCQYLLELNI